MNNNSNKITILIVDDHAIVRMGLRALLSTEPKFEVIAEASDGDEACAKVKELKPNIVVMDILMPGCNGIDATEKIRKLSRRARIVILTTSTSARDLARVKAAGARAIVIKGASNDEIITAIHEVSAGKNYISPEAKAILDANPTFTKMTARQTQILTALAHGLTNKEIGKLCGVSANCIKLHIAAIYDKLGAANRAEAVMIGLRDHIIPED